MRLFWVAGVLPSPGVLLALDGPRRTATLVRSRSPTGTFVLFCVFIAFWPGFRQYKIFSDFRNDGWHYLKEVLVF